MSDTNDPRPDNFWPCPIESSLGISLGERVPATTCFSVYSVRGACINIHATTDEMRRFADLLMRMANWEDRETARKLARVDALVQQTDAKLAEMSAELAPVLGGEA